MGQRAARQRRCASNRGGQQRKRSQGTKPRGEESSWLGGWVLTLLPTAPRRTQAPPAAAASPPSPPSAGWVVLGLPEGQLTLDRQLSLNRSQTVLRGAGRGRTVLYITKSMMDLFGGWVGGGAPGGGGGGGARARRLVRQQRCTCSGIHIAGPSCLPHHLWPPHASTTPAGPAPYHPDGYWVWYGGLLSAVGETNQTWLAKVNATPPVPRGSNKFLVDNVGKLAVGQTVSLLYNGGNGTFKHEM